MHLAHAMPSVVSSPNDFVIAIIIALCSSRSAFSMLIGSGGGETRCTMVVLCLAKPAIGKPKSQSTTTHGSVHPVMYDTARMKAMFRCCKSGLCHAWAC